MNFFANELYQYYLEHGITLSTEIINVLNKSPIELTNNEKGLFIRFLLPRRHQIKQALRTRFTRSGADQESWANAALSYSQSIIGQIASEMLIEEEVMALGPTLMSLPVMAGPLSAPRFSSPQEASPQAQPPVKERREKPPGERQAVMQGAQPPLPLEQDIPTIQPDRSPSPTSPFFGLNIRRGSRQIFKKKRRTAGTIITAGIIVLALLMLVFLFSSWGRDLFKRKEIKAAASERVEKTSDTGQPTIGLIVDDVGESTEYLDNWLAIDAPLTFSILPRTAHSQELAEQLYEAGYRIMLNIPTESQQPHPYAGKGQISMGVDRGTLLRTLDDNLATVPHASGINNHEGQAACTDLQLMLWQCEWAKANKLFVVDSRTTKNSMVSTAAEALGLDRKYNQVFIDEYNRPDYIRSAMGQLASLARANGVAIGICNFPRSNTATIVRESILELQAQGIHFAFVQDLRN